MCNWRNERHSHIGKIFESLVVIPTQFGTDMCMAIALSSVQHLETQHCIY